MKLREILTLCAVALSVLALGLTGCELDEEASDGGATCTGDACPAGDATDASDATADTGPDVVAGPVCDGDGWCNPADENASSRTASVCPRRVVVHSLVSRLHSLTV